MEIITANFGYTTIKTNCYSNFPIFYEVCNYILLSGILILYLLCVLLRYHTLVLGSSGQIWAFGSGSKGQIGTGRQDDVLTPTTVELPWMADGAAAPAGAYSVCVLAVE